MSGQFEDFGTGRRSSGRDSVDAFTAQVVRAEGGLSWVAELGDDTSQPIGPCRGPAVIAGDVVLVVWTAQGPWVAQVAT